MKEREQLRFYRNAVQQITQTSLKSANKINKAGGLVYNRQEPSPTAMTVNMKEVNSTDAFLANILPEISTARYANHNSMFFNAAFAHAQKELTDSTPSSERFIYITLSGNLPRNLNRDILKLKERKALVFVINVATDLSEAQLERTLSNADFVFVANKWEDLQKVKNSIIDVKAKGILKNFFK